jgi:hypothetical protein
MRTQIQSGSATMSPTALPRVLRGVLAGVCMLGLVATTWADQTEGIINQTSIAEYQSYLRVLTGVDPVPGSPPVYLQNRYSFGQDILVAGQWIQNQFTSFGLSSTLQTYDPTYGPNVVAQRTGTTRPNDIYVISGHYDTYHAGDQLHAPGCDDDGSGTAATMMAARILSQYQFAGTIRFVAFSGEEQWMVGSQAYVKACHDAGENIVADINLDMILHPGFDNQNPDPDYDLDIEGNPASLGLANYLAGKYAAYTPIAVQVHDDPNLVSDHWSFWNYGYQAVGLAENTDYEIWGGSNDAYHQLTDVMSNPDYDWDFARHAIRGGMAGLVDLAEVVPEPATGQLVVMLGALGALRRRRGR